jgi:hypothetical protein
VVAGSVTITGTVILIVKRLEFVNGVFSEKFV